MTVHLNTENGFAKARVEGEMTIYQAAELKGPLVDALHECREMEIDLTDVGEIDTAGIQVLLLMKREAERAGKALRLVCPSAAVIGVFALYNLVSYLNDSNAAHERPAADPAC